MSLARLITPDKQFAAIRQATVAHLRGLFPQIKTINEHEGEFNRASIKAMSMRAPALHVAVLGIKPVEHVSAGGIGCTLEMAIFVTTKDAPGETRDLAALSIAAGLLLCMDRFVPFADGVNLSQPATRLTWRNLFEPDEQSQGVMMSVLAYSQTVNLQAVFREMFAVDPMFLRELHVGEYLVLQAPVTP